MITVGACPPEPWKFAAVLHPRALRHPAQRVAPRTSIASVT